MTEAHIPAAAALEQVCFSQPWSAQVLQAELKNTTAYFLAARENNKLAGYAGMYHVLDEGYIANIAVAPEFRRRGVGTMLLEGLLAHARAHALSFLTLEVRESNLPAIALYSKVGFSQVGRRRGFYEAPCEDALLMTAFLHQQENSARC